MANKARLAKSLFISVAVNTAVVSAVGSSHLLHGAPKGKPDIEKMLDARPLDAYPRPNAIALPTPTPTPPPIALPKLTSSASKNTAQAGGAAAPQTDAAVQLVALAGQSDAGAITGSAQSASAGQGEGKAGQNNGSGTGHLSQNKGSSRSGASTPASRAIGDAVGEGAVGSSPSAGAGLAKGGGSDAPAAGEGNGAASGARSGGSRSGATGREASSAQHSGDKSAASAHKNGTSRVASSGHSAEGKSAEAKSNEGQSRVAKAAERPTQAETKASGKAIDAKKTVWAGRAAPKAGAAQNTEVGASGERLADTPADADNAATASSFVTPSTKTVGVTKRAGQSGASSQGEGKSGSAKSRTSLSKTKATTTRTRVALASTTPSLDAADARQNETKNTKTVGAATSKQTRPEADDQSADDLTGPEEATPAPDQTTPAPAPKTVSGLLSHVVLKNWNAAPGQKITLPEKLDLSLLKDLKGLPVSSVQLTDEQREQIRKMLEGQDLKQIQGMDKSLLKKLIDASKRADKVPEDAAEDFDLNKPERKHGPKRAGAPRSRGEHKKRDPRDEFALLPTGMTSPFRYRPWSPAYRSRYEHVVRDPVESQTRIAAVPGLQQQISGLMGGKSPRDVAAATGSPNVAPAAATPSTGTRFAANTPVGAPDATASNPQGAPANNGQSPVEAVPSGNATNPAPAAGPANNNAPSNANANPGGPTTNGAAANNGVPVGNAANGGALGAGIQGAGVLNTGAPGGAANGGQAGGAPTTANGALGAGGSVAPGAPAANGQNSNGPPGGGSQGGALVGAKGPLGAGATQNGQPGVPGLGGVDNTAPGGQPGGGQPGGGQPGGGQPGGGQPGGGQPGGGQPGGGQPGGGQPGGGQPGGGQPGGGQPGGGQPGGGQPGGGQPGGGQPGGGQPGGGQPGGGQPGGGVSPNGVNAGNPTNGGTAAVGGVGAPTQGGATGAAQTGGQPNVGATAPGGVPGGNSQPSGLDQANPGQPGGHANGANNNGAPVGGNNPGGVVANNNGGGANGGNAPGDVLGGAQGQPGQRAPVNGGSAPGGAQGQPSGQGQPGAQGQQVGGALNGGAVMQGGGSPTGGGFTGPTGGPQGGQPGGGSPGGGSPGGGSPGVAERGGSPGGGSPGGGQPGSGSASTGGASTSGGSASQGGAGGFGGSPTGGGTANVDFGETQAASEPEMAGEVDWGAALESEDVGQDVSVGDNTLKEMRRANAAALADLLPAGAPTSVGQQPNLPEHNYAQQKGLAGALVLPPLPPLGTVRGLNPQPRPVVHASRPTPSRSAVDALVLTPKAVRAQSKALEAQPRAQSESTEPKAFQAGQVAAPRFVRHETQKPVEAQQPSSPPLQETPPAAPFGSLSERGTIALVAGKGERLPLGDPTGQLEATPGATTNAPVARRGVPSRFAKVVGPSHRVPPQARRDGSDLPAQEKQSQERRPLAALQGEEGDVLRQAMPGTLDGVGDEALLVPGQERDVKAQPGATEPVLQRVDEVAPEDGLSAIEKKARNSRGVKDGSLSPIPPTPLPDSDAELGDGSGLKGEYYSGRNFEQYEFTRADKNLDLFWGGETSPSPKLPVGGSWAARWTGRLKTRYGETYTLYATADDGVRVWVNHKLVIDGWGLHPVQEYAAELKFEAGKQYNIRVDYFEDGGPPAAIGLYWESKSQKKEFIPEECLFYPLAGSKNDLALDEKPQ